jgi:hypothetical protein
MAAAEWRARRLAERRRRTRRAAEWRAAEWLAARLAAEWRAGRLAERRRRTWLAERRLAESAALTHGVQMFRRKRKHAAAGIRRRGMFRLCV